MSKKVNEGNKLTYIRGKGFIAFLTKALRTYRRRYHKCKEIEIARLPNIFLAQAVAIFFFLEKKMGKTTRNHEFG